MRTLERVPLKEEVGDACTALESYRKESIYKGDICKQLISTKKNQNSVLYPSRRCFIEYGIGDGDRRLPAIGNLQKNMMIG